MIRSFTCVRSALLVALTSFVAVGCESPTFNELPSHMRQVSVTAIDGPGSPLPSSGTWSWMSGSGVSLHNPAVDSGFVEAVIRDAIEVELAERGWTRGSSSGSDMFVGYVAALSEEMSDSDLIRRFGLSPGLSSAGIRHGKGSLVLLVSTPGNSAPAWRGVAQALADLELSNEVREQRVRGAVNVLVSNIPMR